MLAVLEHQKVDILGRTSIFFADLLNEQTLHVLHHHNELVDVFTRDNLAIIVSRNIHKLFKSLDFFVFQGYLLIVVLASSIVYGIIDVLSYVFFILFDKPDVILDLRERHHDVLGLRLRLC